MAKKVQSKTSKKASVKKVAKPVASKAKSASKQKVQAKPANKKSAGKAVVKSTVAKKAEAKKAEAKKVPVKKQAKPTKVSKVAPKPVAKKQTSKVVVKTETKKAVKKPEVKTEKQTSKKIVAVQNKVSFSVQAKQKKQKKTSSKISVNVKASSNKKTSAVNVSVSKKPEDEILQTLSSIVVKPENSNFSIRDDRPSHHIAFTLDDLDAYFKNLGNNALPKKSQNKEIKASVVKTSQAKRQAKGVVKLENKSEGVATLFDILGFNPAETPSLEKLEIQSVPKKWRKYYNMLVDLRSHHSEGVESRSEEVLKRSAKEDSGDLSTYGQHLADAGSSSFERDLAYNMISNQTEILAEIEAAIKRIKDGTYGICEVTGKPIPEARLNAIPFARYTKEGQEIHELEQMRMKTTRQEDIFEMDMDGTSNSRKNDDEDSIVGE